MDYKIRMNEGRAKHPLYGLYSNMKNRCYNSNNPSFARYGGRGITVCDDWLGIDGFWHFVRDMGERPTGKSLDRINNNLGYCPENCRWATVAEQNVNRRSNSETIGVCWAGCSYKAYITVDGKTITRRFKEKDAALKWRHKMEKGKEELVRENQNEYHK